MPLAVCATPIGNLDDVTLRVLDELRAADLVLCEDTRRTRILLGRHGIEARLSSYHRHNEAARTAQVLESLRAGERVALVSDAGLPGVNDPGARLIAAAVEAGIEVTVLPGASAVETALVVSGLAADRYQFVGYLPRRVGRAASARRGARLLVGQQSWRSSRRVDCRRRWACWRRSFRGGAQPCVASSRSGSRRSCAGRSRSWPRDSPSRRAGRSRSCWHRPPMRAMAGSDEDARAAVAELVDAGASRRTAAEVVSKLTGTPRNALYRDSL